MLIDMHVHTREGSICSWVSAKDTILKLKEKNINGCVFTDHESIKGYLSIINDKELLKDFTLICGMEYTTDLGDMLIILPNINNYELLTQKYIGDPFELIDIVHKLNGVIGVAHPYRDGLSSIALNTKNYEQFDKIFSSVDFIEVENGGADETSNYNAEWIAKDFNKFQSKGSDSHHIEYVGKTATEFKQDVDQIKIIEYIKRNKL